MPCQCGYSDGDIPSGYPHWHGIFVFFSIPHLKILSRDWLTKVGHSIMSTGEMSTGKMSTVVTSDS